MFPLILVGACFVLAGFMAWLAWNLDEKQQAFKFFYFGLMLLFLVYGTWQVAFLAGEPEVKLNYTDEYSFYWNCSVLRNTCEGTPDTDACTAYTEVQCNNIAGCLWEQDACTGTPSVSCSWLGAYDYTGSKCQETIGCTWGAMEVEGTCDRVMVFQDYANYTSPYESYGDSITVLATALMLVMLLLVLYLFVVYFGSLIGRMDGKPPKNDFIDNEYGRPY